MKIIILCMCLLWTVYAGAYDRDELIAELAVMDDYRRAGEHQKAMQAADAFLAREALPDSLRGKAILRRVKAMTRLKDWEKEDYFIIQIENIAPKIEDKTLLRALWRSAIFLEYGQFKLKEAEVLAYKGLAVFAENPDATQIDMLMLLGAIFSQQGDHSAGLEQMLAAYRLSELLGIAPSFSMLQNLGGIYFYLEEWEEAIFYTGKAIDATEEGSFLLVSLYTNMSAAYDGAGDFDKALENASKAWELSVQVNRPGAGAANNLGYFLEQKGQLQEALQMLETAGELYAEAGEFQGVGVVKKNLGETWIKLGDRARAETFLEESYDLYIKYDYRPKRLELYPVMIENLKSLGKTARALKLMEEFKTLSDETINVESKEKIARLQSAVELERKDKELSALERDRALKEKEIVVLQKTEEKQQVVRTYLAILVVVLGLVALLLIRSLRFRSRANRVLSEKNQRIESQHNELEKLAAELRMQSLEDPLTELKNRRYLNEFITAEIPYVGRSLQEDAPRKMVVIIADLDDFKGINDRYGHTVGDQVIVLMANILRECARESDIVVRWGGEEFCWLCRDTGIDDAAVLCERVQNALRKASVQVGADQIKVTCSLGFAPFPLTDDVGLDWKWSLNLADSAMYHAKEAGKDGWAGFAVNTWPEWQKDSQLNIEKLLQEGSIERRLDPGLVAG